MNMLMIIALVSTVGVFLASIILSVVMAGF